jgi:hypothetical protein
MRKAVSNSIKPSEFVYNTRCDQVGNGSMNP